MRLWNGLLILCIALAGVVAVKVQSMAQTKLDIIWSNILIDTSYYSVVFSEGLAMVKVDGRGYINKKGQLAILPQFDEADDFSEGLARVKLNGNYKYINKEGNLIAESQFDKAKELYEEHGSVEVNGKRVYINEGLAVVEVNGKYGYINKEGNVVIEPQFDNAGEFTEGLAMVHLDGKWGILRNPLSVAVHEKSLDQAGLFVGTVSKVVPGEILVEGNAVADKVSMGEKLCLYSGDSIIILRSTFPMKTVTKCGLVQVI